MQQAALQDHLMVRHFMVPELHAVGRAEKAAGPEVTESARACIYYSDSADSHPETPPVVPFFILFYQYI